MKKLIAAATLLAVTTVQAAEELKFGDLNYFLKEGEFNVIANANSSYQKVTSQGETAETRGYIFETQFAYALSNQLNAFVGLNYAWDLQTETAGNADIDNDGLANPALGLNYRLLNQNQSDFNLDFGGVARVNIEDAKTGDAVGQNVKDGNFADGRSSLELNTRLGKKWNESNEWQLSGGLVYFADGESTRKLTTGDEELDDDSSLNLFLGAAYQYRPVNEFMMLVSARATQVGESESKIKGGDKIERDAHLDLNFQFTAKYLIKKNFIAKFNYGMSRNPDYDISEGATNDEVRKRRENFFGFGVDFLF